MTKFALMLIASGLGAGIASAQPVTVYGSSEPSAVVSYADLNLGSTKGIQRLHNRVRSAASDLCLELTREDLASSLQRTKCYRTAVGDGQMQIDRLVAERLAGQFGTGSTITLSAR